MVLMLFSEESKKTYNDTQRIQNAIDTVSKKGGGKVVLSGGCFYSGPLELKSNTTLVIEEKSILNFSDDFLMYKPVWTRWEGVECWGMHPLIFAHNVKNIRISGKGKIDGNGAKWWDFLKKARSKNRKQPHYVFEKELEKLNTNYMSQPSGGGGRELQFLRPPLVQLVNCEDVEISDITLQNSPFWNTHIVYCNRVKIKNSHFINPHDAPNTDGLNIDSSSDVRIEHCYFDVGDDCLGLKSGAGDDGLRVGKPTKDVSIENCKMKSGHGGIVIGSETAGGIKDVYISNCELNGTDRGLRIKTRRGRGGEIRNIHLEKCTMIENYCPLVINCFYGPGGPSPDSPVFSTSAQEVDSKTPEISNISISGLNAIECKSAAAFIVGLPERPIRNIEIKNSSFHISEKDIRPVNLSAMYRGLEDAAGRGIRLRNIENIRIINSQVTFPSIFKDQSAFILEENIKNITME